MEIQAVIFDMGGVLVRSMDHGPRTRLGARFGMTYEDIDALVFGSPSANLASVGRIGEEEHWETIRARLQLSLAEMEQFREEFWAGDQVDRGLLAYLQSLRPAIKTGLLSNAWSGARNFLQERYGLLDTFDVAIFSAEVKLAKPDPAIYYLMLERLGAQPQNAVFVDDFPVNVEAARMVGMETILFSDPAKTIIALEKIVQR